MMECEECILELLLIPFSSVTVITPFTLHNSEDGDLQDNKFVICFYGC
jgi:hypothetical protein